MCVYEDGKVRRKFYKGFIFLQRKKLSTLPQNFALLYECECHLNIIPLSSTIIFLFSDPWAIASETGNKICLDDAAKSSAVCVMFDIFVNLKL